MIDVRRTGLALLAAGLFSCNPPVNGAPCVTADECPQGQLCLPNGKCEPPGISSPTATGSTTATGGTTTAATSAGATGGTSGGGASGTSGTAGGGTGTSGGTAGGTGTAGDGGGSCAGLPDGTACGSGMACAAGACACEAGDSCSLGFDPCSFGLSGCQGGSLSCGGRQSALDGTACGVGRVCSSGVCTTCRAGDTCSPAACQSGRLSCDSGLPVCTAPVSLPDGTSCGSGAVCQGGSCVACAAGQACTAPGNPCLAGTLDCGSGTAVCGGTSPVPDGTPCAGGACASGSCAACQTGAACSPGGVPCLVGKLDCSHGAACLGPFTDRPDGSSCGPGQTCQAGACACQNPCTSAGQSCGGPASVIACTQDARGCFEQVTTPCPAGKPCVGGQCVCQDQCQPGQTACADGGAASICAQQADGCWAWAAPTACPGTSTCVAGACGCAAPSPGQWAVDGAQGSDALGNGSASCPFGSISHALELAAAGAEPSEIDVKAVSVAYGAATGESFPLVVPLGVSLVGLGKPLVEGLGPVGGGSGVSAAVVAFGDVVGFEISPGTNQGGSVGVYCDAFAPTVQDDDVHGFDVGLQIDGSCRALVSACDVHGNGTATGAGIVVVGSGAPAIQGSRLHGNAAGLSVVSAAPTPTALVGDEIDDNAADGLDCGAGAHLALRRCFVHANQGAGVSLSGRCAADLSGVDSSGGCGEANTLTCNAQGDLATSSSVTVQADHDDWDSEPPGGADVQTTPGSAAVVLPTCSEVAGAPNPQPPPTGCP